MFSLLLITCAFAQTVTDEVEMGEATLETDLHHPSFKVEFVAAMDFKPTFFADPRAVAGVVIADASGIGYKISASPEGIDMLAPQIPVPGLADMLEGFEVTMSYNTPYDRPTWNDTDYGAHITSSAVKYEWN